MDFIAKANKIHNNLYDYSESNYVNYKTKIKIVCPHHGVFEQSPHIHISLKHGCPKCAINNRKMTTNNFISRSKSIHKNKYDYSKTIYERADQKVSVICPDHGIFEIRARDHLSGRGCQKCAKKNKNNNNLTTKEFIERSQKIHHHKYNYSKSIYKNGYTKITIICPQHGEFKQKPCIHLRGHGCKKCSIESSRNNYDEFKKKANIVHGNQYDYSLSNYINARENIEIICPKHGPFNQIVNNHLAGSGCPKCPATISSFHQDVIQHIGSDIDFSINERNIISQEIDIYIPKFKLGIELNGDYWHSWHPHNDKAENRQKHVNKHKECYKNNIKLLQISEHEWVNTNTREIWKSIINHHLNKTQHIYYARKCSVLTNFEYSEFFDNNHLQGNRNTTIRIGLEYDKKLISAMTFKEHSKNNWEIIRYATIINSQVIGGASKIFKNFIRLYDPKSIITFSDLRYSNGNIYKKLGFEYLHRTEPGYVYLKHKSILSRHKCQKHKLEKLLPIFDKNKSESENMFMNGYRRLYNAGNFKFLWK